jgi:hypothetical protein
MLLQSLWVYFSSQSSYTDFYSFQRLLFGRLLFPQEFRAQNNGHFYSYSHPSSRFISHLLFPTLTFTSSKTSQSFSLCFIFVGLLYRLARFVFSIFSFWVTRSYSLIQYAVMKRWYKGLHLTQSSKARFIAACCIFSFPIVYFFPISNLFLLNFSLH